MIEKARSASAGDLGVHLADDVCVYLLAVIVADLGLKDRFPELPSEIPPFYTAQNLAALRISGVSFLGLMERLVELNRDADTFFACLANLHKRRLKYDRILKCQPIPTIEQVGPRGLLQFGAMSPRALAGLLFWRKWLFDIDNRAGQETGYLFEPIIAHAIGGAPVASRGSPVRRSKDSSKGRQVDCIREQRAYEFKIRITIASSGQGRWQEELDFPVDARSSGFLPVLIVLDATPNVKLARLEAEFLAVSGEVYKGAEAWNHLESMAGPTMSLFLERYVRIPIQSLLSDAPDSLPEFHARMDSGTITLSIGDERFLIQRAAVATQVEDEEALPPDVADQIPGP